jgi:polyhydroxybutyrate depolymerase
MLEKKLIHDGLERNYLQYTPLDFKDGDSINLVIGLHGYTGSASGFEKETTGIFNLSAEKYNFISIYPQGLYFHNDNDNSFISSWNDMTASKGYSSKGEICAADAIIYPKYPNCKNLNRCTWSSCGDDLGFLKKIIDLTKDNYNIDKVYVLGMSNGGMMAQALACEYPHLFAGVVNVVGMQHLGLSCTPDSPVNFIIYGGKKDEVVPPINIKSNDGYYYEPMKNTFNAWSKKFRCQKNKTNKINNFNKLTKKTSFECDNDVQIISILNHDAGHLWPGINTSRGYCQTDSQKNNIFPKCTIENPNHKGNDFLLNILFNL